jgi:sugar lactone lactonase YvrE
MFDISDTRTNNNSVKEERMIEKRFSGATIIACILLCVLSLAASGMVWADSYSFSKQIQRGLAFGVLTGPLDVDVRPDGKMFVADQSNRRVLHFDEYGKFVWGCLFPPGTVPIAISVDHSGHFYYVSRFKGVFGYDVLKMPASNSCTRTTLAPPPGGFDSPFGLAVGADGSLYVADTFNHRIVKYDVNGVFVTQWGQEGNELGDVDTPLDVAVHTTGIILVADTGNDRVQAFAPNGFPFGMAGETGTGPLQFNAPSGIGIGPDGAVFVADTGNNRIQKGYLPDVNFPDGRFAGEFGNSDLSGPNGLAVDMGGNVSVADTFNDRIAIFQPDVLVFDNGADSKVVTMPAPVSFTLDIQPDAYWSDVPAEMFAGAGRPGLMVYLNTFPLTGTGDGWVPFGSFLGVRPFLVLRVPTLSVTADVLDDSSGLGGNWTVVVCLDRNINGIYNPSSSVCDSIDVTVQ